MLLKIKYKTWIQLFKECLNCKNSVEAKLWLEKEALRLKKKHPGYKISGVKYLIKMNLSALLKYYDSSTEKKLVQLLGISRRMFGGVTNDRDN